MLQTDFVREVAEAVVKDELLLNWVFYAVLGSVTLVSGAIASWVSSYLQSRGKTLATKADLSEISRQLATTTRATEEIRSEISHADWLAREWRATRRLKLEELVTAAAALGRWLDTQSERLLDGKPSVDDGAPLEKIRVLGRLYFSEIKKQTEAVWLAHYELYALLLKTKSKQFSARQANDLDAFKAASDELMEDAKPLHDRAAQTLVELNTRAPGLMEEIFSAPD